MAGKIERETEDQGRFHGLLPVNKPVGMISKDVSRWFSKKFGKKEKIGHVGTLDPDAGGVLPILLGRATRVQDILLEFPKTYEFEVRFGIETDTLDMAGEVIKQVETNKFSLDEVKDVAAKFLGTIEQLPPVYSAIKYQGTPLYKLGRSGRADSIPIENLRRKVLIKSLDVLSLGEESASFRVTCSKGTYVRSLARDIAYALNTLGTVCRLIRTEAAGIFLEQAVNFARLQGGEENIESFVIPIEKMHLGIPEIVIKEIELVERLCHGQPIWLDDYPLKSVVSGDTSSETGVQIQLKNTGNLIFALGVAKRIENRLQVRVKRRL